MSDSLDVESEVLVILAHVLGSCEDCRIQAFNDGKDRCIVRLEW